MKNATFPKTQRQIFVDDPVLQPAYKIAQSHANDAGRNVILYRDFYLGHFDEDVAEVTHSQMKAARRHFRLHRGLAEGPDPVLVLEFRKKLQSQGLIPVARKKTVFGVLRTSRIPKRYRKI